MIKLSDTMQKVDLLKTQQVGRVVENNDPRQLLRIKVYVKGVYEDSDVSKLPWVFPKGDSGLGGKPDSSSFFVPEVGSEVLVYWPTGDIYSPYYEGRRLNSMTAPKEPFVGPDADYPNTYGMLDSSGQWFRVNKLQKFFEYFSSNVGHFVKFDGDGNLTIKIPKNVILQVGGELQIGVGGSSIISSGVNHVNTAGNNTFMSACNSFGMTGGGGGINSSCAGPVHIQSGSVFSIDAASIHENSGTYPGGSGTPTEISALQSALSAIQSTIQGLSNQAQAIQQRLSEVADKIGK